MSNNRQQEPTRRGLLTSLFLGLLVPLALFGVLAEDVWLNEGFGWDPQILLALHARATSSFDTIMLFFTRVGETVPMAFLTALLVAVLVLRRYRAEALFLAIAVGGAAALDVAAKLLFQRARPALWVSLAPETNYSFPSGHAMGSFALVAALIILIWRTPWRWAIIVTGTLFVGSVGLSRVYLGVHYPSDVLAGWCASLAWVTGVWRCWVAARARIDARTRDSVSAREVMLTGPRPSGVGRLKR